MDTNKIVVNGLVLAGGKSVRMGHSKASIKWHGKEQQYYVADLIRPFCNDVFISCRPEQKETIENDYKTIEDAFPFSGPLGAILSAFNYAEKNAWLVVACDLPLLDKKTIAFLMENRDARAIATAFESPVDGLPEPLIAIWEPTSFDIVKKAFSEQRFCPRKVLMNNKPALIKAPNPEALFNANTPEDAEKVKAKLLHVAK